MNQQLKDYNFAALPMLKEVYIIIKKFEIEQESLGYLYLSVKDNSNF